MEVSDETRNCFCIGADTNYFYPKEQEKCVL